MKYCKILTHEVEPSVESGFYARSIIQTGYESDDGNIQVLACINEHESSNLRTRIINKNTGDVFDSVMPLNIDPYNYNTTAPGNGTYVHFNGWFHVTPVQNKPNEVMVKICGDIYRYNYSSSGQSGTRVNLRLCRVLDVTTGEVKANMYIYYPEASGNSGVAYLVSEQFPFSNGSTDYCYYNATYDAYYTPMQGGCSSSSPVYKNGYLMYVAAGVNEVRQTNGRPTSGSEYYGWAQPLGKSFGLASHSESYTYYGASWYVPLTDTTGLGYFFDAYYNYMHVYSVEQTAIKTFSTTALYSNTSFITFSSSSASMWYPGQNSNIVYHVLRTDTDELYFYGVGYLHTSLEGYESNKYHGILRIGPFSLNTSADNPPIATIIDGISSSDMSKYRFNLFGCLNGDPDKLLYALLPTPTTTGSGTSGVYAAGAVVFAEVGPDTEIKTHRVMLNETMCSSSASGAARTTFRYDGINNPWSKGYTLPTCWYNNKLTKMFICDMHRNVTLGDFSSCVYEDAIETWTCPEDGLYKIIMVGGGAAGGSSYGGGSGYMRILTRECTAGEEIPYHIGYGGVVMPDFSNPYAVHPRESLTWFGDRGTFALGGVKSRGGANGYPSSSGGGGGGYDLIEYGGNGQQASLVPRRNGGQGTTPAAGYGAGGCSNQSGSDGVIVILR